MVINLKKGIDIVIVNEDIQKTFTLDGQIEKRCLLYFRLEIEGHGKEHQPHFRWDFHECDYFVNKYFPSISHSTNRCLFSHPIFLVKEWDWEQVYAKILKVFQSITLPNILVEEEVYRFWLKIDMLFYMPQREDAFWHYFLSTSDSPKLQIGFSHAYEGCQLDFDTSRKITSLEEYKPFDEKLFDLYLCFNITLPSGYIKKAYLTVTSPSMFKERYDLIMNSTSDKYKRAYKNLMLKKYDPKAIDFILSLQEYSLTNLITEHDLLLEAYRFFHFEETIEL